MFLKHNLRLMSLIAAAMLFSGTLLKAEEAVNDGGGGKPVAVETGKSKPAKDPVAQLRGKLLYKRSQIRKLEKAAKGNDPALQEKVQKLQGEIEEAFSAAEPKLLNLYAEEKQLVSQIDSMAKQK